jgi:putative ABC transport system permease protein
VSAVDPGPYPGAQPTTNAIAAAITATATLLALLLAVVAALGVFNSVVLTARVRRRDAGILEALGITSNHVVAMMVTSTALPALVGALVGIPLGMALRRLVVPAMAHAAGIGFPPSMLDVWHATTLVLLALAGVAIAALGAFVPARAAARLTAATALQPE